MYEISFLDEAIRDLKKLDKITSSRIVSKLNWLALNLNEIKLESLKGEFSHLFKLRVGDYRILYELITNDNLIIVHLIGHRSDIYE